MVGTYFVSWGMDTIIPWSAAIFIQHSETSWNWEKLDRKLPAKIHPEFFAPNTNRFQNDTALVIVVLQTLHFWQRFQNDAVLHRRRVNGRRNSIENDAATNETMSV